MDKKSEKTPWDVLFYEIQMYWETGRLLKSIGIANWGVIELGNGAVINTEYYFVFMNALIESKLLHSRILCEFFLAFSNEVDDISIEQLQPGWKADEKIVELVEVLRNAYGSRSDANSPRWAVNKMLAHLTTHRSDSYSYGWYFEKIDAPLQSCIQRFAEISNQKRILQMIQGK